MSCPICDNKPANCDCPSSAIMLHEENQRLKLQVCAINRTWKKIIGQVRQGTVQPGLIDEMSDALAGYHVVEKRDPSCHVFHEWDNTGPAGKCVKCGVEHPGLPG